MRFPLHLTEIPPRHGARLAFPAGLLTLLLVTALHCGGDPPPPTELQVVLGTAETGPMGVSDWLDVRDGQQVKLASGAQGGFHIWTLFRVLGNPVQRRVVVRRQIDRLGPDNSRQRILTAMSSELIPSEPVWELSVPMASFVCPTPIGVNALNAPLELELRIEAPADVNPGPLLGVARVQVNATCPSSVDGDMQYEFCQRICTG